MTLALTMHVKRTATWLLLLLQSFWVEPLRQLGVPAMMEAEININSEWEQRHLGRKRQNLVLFYVFVCLFDVSNLCRGPFFFTFEARYSLT